MHRLTYYDAMAFCKNFGGHLVEFNTIGEYNYITSTGKLIPHKTRPERLLVVYLQ